ncbi:MAG: hypothetical protein IJS01_09935 [Lentisphaeria bacterium]|nr:hypothetical protein [Lentisphaeria bacterium]
MVEITNLRQGVVLNHNHGVETENELRITVEGFSSDGMPVTVNGVPAEMDGRRFSAGIGLTKKFNVVKAETVTPFGVFSQEIVAVWDKKSFKRSNFYIDDHSFLFTELARDRPKSAFDHFYLAGLKEIHKNYGTKFTLNAFYENAHHGFLLKDMPDTWKSEFIDNSDWLKFSFHARSEFPDRLYAEATAEEFGRDWDQVQNEIVRFAGEESYIAPVVIHWANIHPAVAQEMIRRGTTCYSTALRMRIMGGPSLADRQKGGDMKSVTQRSLSGADRDAGTLGFKMHYDRIEETGYLEKHHCYYDPLLKLFFFRTNGVCCNLVPLDEIEPRLRTTFGNAAKRGVEIFGNASHEQYTFPCYPNYLPDHMQRLACAARVMRENGCEPVFFTEGILGNTAWD